MSLIRAHGGSINRHVELARAFARVTRSGDVHIQVRLIADGLTESEGGWRMFHRHSPAVMEVMGWSDASIAKRYMHVPSEFLSAIADQVGGLVWPAAADGDEPERG